MFYSFGISQRHYSFSLQIFTCTYTDSASVDVFSDTASECSDASKRSSVKMNNEILEQQQYYQQQLTHYQVHKE